MRRGEAIQGWPENPSAPVFHNRRSTLPNATVALIVQRDISRVQDQIGVWRRRKLPSGDPERIPRETKRIRWTRARHNRTAEVDSMRLSVQQGMQLELIHVFLISIRIAPSSVDVSEEFGCAW